jgi:hypothetical protein
MPNTLRDLHRVDETSFDYIFEENATVVLKDGRGFVRCNVYRPKSTTEKVPCLVTYGELLCPLITHAMEYRGGL